LLPDFCHDTFCNCRQVILKVTEMKKCRANTRLSSPAGKFTGTGKAFCLTAEMIKEVDSSDQVSNDRIFVETAITE